MANRRIEISQTGKLWMPLLGLGIIGFAIWQLGGSISAGSPKFALLLGAGFVAFFVAGRIANDWRSGVALFFVWLTFEDLVRKYMFNDMAIYFAKDALVAVTYISLFTSGVGRDLKFFRPPFRYPLALFFVAGLVEVFNPRSPSVFYGLLGLKLYFYYIPLMFVGYAMLRTVNDLRRFLILSMAVASVVSLVGILQTVIGISFLNPRGSEAIDELGHGFRITSGGLVVVRPPSVFVSDGRFGEYLTVLFILGLGAAGFLLLRRVSGRKVVFPALGLIAMATILSGGRTTFMIVGASALLLSVGMIWGAPQGVGESYPLIKAIRRSFIFVALAIGLSVMVFPEAIGSHVTYYRETLMPNSEYSQTSTRTWSYPVQQLMYAVDNPDWVLGHGIGTASLGAQYVSSILRVPNSNLGVENGFGTLILEFGILGPILWLLWSIALVIGCARAVMRLKGSWAFPVGLSIAWFAFLQLLPLTWGSMNGYQNFIANAYLWLSVGFLFRLPGLVEEDRIQPADNLKVTSRRLL